MSSRARRLIRTADRISALPDSVLWRILSLLPTKQAVATSVLSKRWRPLWLSLRTLDLDDQTFPDFLCFRHFAYSVLLSLDIKLPMRSFRLKCGNSSGFNPYDINRFVYAAAQRGIENLNLDMSRTIKLPPSVPCCTNLVVLKLKRLTVNDLPYVDFPLLKTLHLDWVTFKLHEYLRKLLSGCPILEDLWSKDIQVIERLPLWKGEVKSLPNLVRASISGWHISFAWVCNAEFLRADLPSYYCDLDVPIFRNLTHMELIFESKSCDFIVDVLEHCPKLQNLTIHEGWMWGGWNDPLIVPECLSSQLRTCSIRDYKGERDDFQFAKYIMQNSKVLCTMTIQSSSVETSVKHQMLTELSLCPRGSSTCRLLFLTDCG